MATSGIDPSKDIDSSVGGLVWVRRRNGSWWPGRILGRAELPENSLSLPRFGTPVKLLGREDASVDWYNLEKSKRIKAFRCGEYDDCIEKAKIASANLSKKAVKYARREDAILQALELERARLETELPTASGRPDSYAGELNDVDELPSSFYTSKETNGLKEDIIGCDLSDSSCLSQKNKEDSVLSHELSHPDASLKPDLVDVPKEESNNGTIPNDSEDDGTEGVKRMRGIQDLGMGVVSSLKRKRSQVAHVHEFLKRKNRRRTISKVMESTPVVPVPVSTLSNLSSSSVPGSSDSKEVSCKNGSLLKATDNNSNASNRCKYKENRISSPLEVLENNSLERSFDSPLTTEELHSAGVSQKAWISTGAQSSQCSQTGTLSLGNEECNASGSTNSVPGDIHNKNQMVCERMEKGTTDWQLKGKRNSRSRKTDEADTSIDQAGSGLNFERFNGILASDCYDHQAKSRPISEISIEGSQSWNWNVRKDSHFRGFSADLPVPLRSLPYRLSRFTVNPKYDSSEFSLRHHVAISGLYEVPIEVKSDHRPHRVPYISLMSKLTGQPIVGLPVAVEPLSDGFCDDLIKMEQNLGEKSSSLKDLDTIHEQRSRGRPRTKSRRSIPLSKKTKKLSSLTGAHKNQQQKPIVERLEGHSVACVPLTVVFTRINADMNNSTPRPLRRTDEVISQLQNGGMEPNKWVAAVASIWIQSSCGATYVFGIYSPLLKSSQGYDQSTLDTISVFKDIGANVGILSGFLYSAVCNSSHSARWPLFRRPWVVLATGAVQFFVGYFFLWLAVTGAISRPPVLTVCLFMFFAAHAQTFFSTGNVVTAVQNFPEYSGTIVGIMKGYLGISGALLVQIYQTLLKEEPSSFLLMIALLSPLLTIVLMCFVRVDNINIRSDKQYLNEFSWISLMLSLYLMFFISFHNFILLPKWLNAFAFSLLIVILSSPILVAIRAQKPHFTSESTISKTPLLNDKESVIASSSIEMNLFQALKSVNFWLLFVAMICGMGTGMATINNMSQIGESFGYSWKERSMLVSLWSIWNFLGRLGAGYISDVFMHKKGWARPIFTSITLATMVIGHLIISSGFPGNLYIGSLIVGICYGSQWSLMPTITSEIFGIRHMGTIFNTIGTASPLGSYIFSVRIIGYIYDKEGFDSGSGNTCIGAHCFSLSFFILACVSLFGCLISFCLFLKTRDLYADIVRQRCFHQI